MQLYQITGVATLFLFLGFLIAKHGIEVRTVETAGPKMGRVDRSTVEAEESRRPYKRFVYLLQGAARHESRPPLHPSPTRDVIWLTYAKPDGDIFHPKSSWTQGRNHLLDKAIEQAVEMPNGGYEYYILMDSDVSLKSRSGKRMEGLPEDPYERFEGFLMDYQPAMASVAYWWTLYAPGQYSLHHNNDAVFNGFHRETLSFLVPYVDTLDHRSWYYSQHLINSLNAMLYNTRRVQFNDMEAGNDMHTGTSSYTREMLWQVPVCYAQGALQPDSPLRKAFVMNPNPAFTTGVAVKRGNASYIVPEGYIRQHFNLSHPLVERAIKFRGRPDVQKLLKASAGLHPMSGFIPDPRGCTPDHPNPDEKCLNDLCESRR